MGIRYRHYYRDKLNAKFLGVCAGMGDYCRVDPLWFRVGIVLLTLFGTPLVVVGYFLVAMFAKIKPVTMYTESLRHTFGSDDKDDSSDSVARPSIRRETTDE